MPRNKQLLISIIMPAYNEEKLIVRSLHCVKSAARVLSEFGWRHELIVVNNNSSDQTAELAGNEGAQVVFEPVNQISRARNRGAKAAKGDWLVFIDADSYPTAGLFKDMAGKILSGRYIGGGTELIFDNTSLVSHLSVLWNMLTRITRWAAGSFVFCGRDDFNRVGGFSLDMFVSEEIHLSNALKKLGRKTGREFTIIRNHPLLSSGRKTELYTPGEWFYFLWITCRRPLKWMKNRRSCTLWYDGRR